MFRFKNKTARFTVLSPALIPLKSGKVLFETATSSPSQSDSAVPVTVQPVNEHSAPREIDFNDFISSYSQNENSTNCATSASLPLPRTASKLTKSLSLKRRETFVLHLEQEQFVTSLKSRLSEEDVPLLTLAALTLQSEKQKREDGKLLESDFTVNPSDESFEMQLESLLSVPFLEMDKPFETPLLSFLDKPFETSLSDKPLPETPLLETQPIIISPERISNVPLPPPIHSPLITHSFIPLYADPQRTHPTTVSLRHRHLSLLVDAMTLPHMVQRPSRVSLVLSQGSKDRMGARTELQRSKSVTKLFVKSPVLSRANSKNHTIAGHFPKNGNMLSPIMALKHNDMKREAVNRWLRQFETKGVHTPVVTTPWTVKQRKPSRLDKEKAKRRLTLIQQLDALIVPESESSNVAEKSMTLGK